MDIKPITKEDTQQFEHEWEESDTQKGITYQTRHVIFGAFKDNELTGYIKLKIRGGVANLSALIVKKHARNTGTGKALLDHFETISKDHNCHKLTLRTSEKHKSALALYKNNGYTTEATLKNDKDHITWYQLCKEIPNNQKQHKQHIHMIERSEPVT